MYNKGTTWETYVLFLAWRLKFDIAINLIAVDLMKPPNPNSHTISYSDEGSHPTRS